MREQLLIWDIIWVSSGGLCPFPLTALSPILVRPVQDLCRLSQPVCFHIYFSSAVNKIQDLISLVSSIPTFSCLLSPMERDLMETSHIGRVFQSFLFSHTVRLWGSVFVPIYDKRKLHWWWPRVTVIWVWQNVVRSHFLVSVFWWKTNICFPPRIWPI